MTSAPKTVLGKESQEFDEHQTIFSVNEGGFFHPGRLVNDRVRRYVLGTVVVNDSPLSTQWCLERLGKMVQPAPDGRIWSEVGYVEALIGDEVTTRYWPVGSSGRFLKRTIRAKVVADGTGSKLVGQSASSLWLRSSSVLLVGVVVGLLTRAALSPSKMSFLDISFALLILGSLTPLVNYRAILEEAGSALHEQWIADGLSSQLLSELSKQSGPHPSARPALREPSWFRKQVERSATVCVALALLILIFK